MDGNATAIGYFNDGRYGYMLPVAFVVLMVATNNIIISSFATLNGFIVSSVLGFTAVMGWDLGIAESIAGIIVIGFSVDYVVHLTHMYMDGFHVGGFSDRDLRISYALEKMGGTVFAGAVTTAGSGAVMWICQLTFFTKMAVLITMTILFSLFYSTLFYSFVCINWAKWNIWRYLKWDMAKKVI